MIKPGTIIYEYEDKSLRRCERFIIQRIYKHTHMSIGCYVISLKDGLKHRFYCKFKETKNRIFFLTHD
jgi:hypothetical protein